MSPSTDTSTEVQELLARSEYPHKWMLQNQMLQNQLVLISTEKMENLLVETSLSEVEFPFDCLMSHIALAYKYSTLNEMDKALKYLKRGGAKFDQLYRNKIIQDLRIAFLHILNATKLLFLLKSEGDTSQDFQIALLSVPEVANMDIPNRTAVQYGLPALFLGNFDLEGKRLALDYLSKAIENDPNESSWYYVRAVFLGEVECAKRLVDKMPTDQEFYLLDKALEIKRAAMYTSHYAALYRQSAKELNRPVRALAGRSKDKCKIQELNEKSAKLYNESLKLNSYCPEILLRCARGLLFLPAPWQDMVRAKSLLDKALLIAPTSNSGFFNLVMAEYYKIKQEPQKAIQYFKECEKKRLYGPTMACIRLEYQLRFNIDFIKRVENLFNIYHQDLEKLNILFELATYSLEVLKDLRKTCHYVDQIISFGNNGEFILKCRPSGAFCSSRFKEKTLYNLLVDQLKNVKVIIMPEEEKRYFDEFLEKLLLRKDNHVDPKCKEDAVTFNKVASKFSLYRISNDTTLTWRRQCIGPATAKQEDAGI